MGASPGLAILNECESYATPELARRLVERADVLDSQSDSGHAADLAGTAHGIAIEWRNPFEEARAMWLLAKTLDTRDRVHEARTAYEAAHQAATRADPANLIAATLAGLLS